MQLPLKYLSASGSVSPFLWLTHIFAHPVTQLARYFLHAEIYALESHWRPHGLYKRHIVTGDFFFYEQLEANCETEWKICESSARGFVDQKQGWVVFMI